MKIAFLIPFALAACGSGTTASPPTAAGKIDPLAFFTGPSHGVGSIKIIFKSSQPLHVTSNGRGDGHGGIFLDQVVRQGNEPPKKRSWHLRPVSTTALTGTLTDASGPVTGSVSGSVLRLAYPMKGGLDASQTLTLQPGGKVLMNRMEVRKFGLTVARIDETITKD